MTDQTLEQTVANLLRSGVALAAAFVLGGGICYLVHHGHEPASDRVFHGEPAEYTTLSGIFAGSLHGDCRAIIQFGLLLLIATPVARVAFSLVAFALEKDRVYVAITTIVLAILLYSLLAQH